MRIKSLEEREWKYEKREVRKTWGTSMCISESSRTGCCLMVRSTWAVMEGVVGYLGTWVLGSGSGSSTSSGGRSSCAPPEPVTKSRVRQWGTVQNGVKECTSYSHSRAVAHRQWARTHVVSG